MSCIWYIENLDTHVFHIVWNSDTVLSQMFHAGAPYRCAHCVLYAFLTTASELLPMDTNILFTLCIRSPFFLRMISVSFFMFASR